MSKKISDEVAFDLKAVLNDRLQQVIDEVVAEFTAPEPALPVGTRVRVLEDEAYFASVSKGDIGTVIGISDYENDEVMVVIDGDDTEWTFRPGVDIEVVSEFQLAEEKAKAEFPFSVGDRVRILEDDAWLAPVKEGDLATITALHYSTYNGAYCAAEVDAKGQWYFRAQDLAAATIAVGDTVEVGYHVNNVWAGLGKVTKIVEFGYGFSGKPIAHVEMTTGEMKGSLGGFDVDELVKAEQPEPAFAVGDRVFSEDFGFGTVTVVDEADCCGTDEVTVKFDDKVYNEYFGRDGVCEYGSVLESLDERELVRLTEYEAVEPGDELILATLAGDSADIKVGEKVTVVNTAWGNLLTAKTADGRTTVRYASRFARA